MRLRVLVACEYSGRVRDAFARLGHFAVSCDLLPTESAPVAGSRHYQGDVRDVLADGWDVMIAHPPCTFLAASGLHWNRRSPPRAAQTDAALAFVRELLDAPVPFIALENPVGCISTRLRPPDQIVQPFDFGEDASKRTCLWLKGLPKLQATARVHGRLFCCGRPLPDIVGAHGCPSCLGKRRARRIYGNQTPTGQNKLGPSADRWKERSRTYPGIAAAFADQWAPFAASRLFASAA